MNQAYKKQVGNIDLQISVLTRILNEKFDLFSLVNRDKDYNKFLTKQFSILRREIDELNVQITALKLERDEWESLVNLK